MPLTLYVDGPRWRLHLTTTAAAHPGIVPVAKGNGYGFGVPRLARRAEWLGADTLAIGTYREAETVRKRFSGDILVMEPWRPFLGDISYDTRIIHTVGRENDLAALAERGARPRVVLEGLTSMRRHGFTAEAMRRLPATPPGVRVEGHALHLPLGTGHVHEVERWLGAAPASRRWFISHLTGAELTTLRQQHRGVELRPRIGTALWLGDRACLEARTTVLDAHSVRRGDRLGYRQRTVLRAGTVLIVSGGTAHGIALEAPTSAATARQRAVAIAKGGLDAAGRALSPFVVAGRQRWFVEPPHMQASMIFLPAGTAVPRIGEEIAVQVRFTTTTFDHVSVS